MIGHKPSTSSYAPSKMPTRHIGAAPTPSGLSPVSSSWSNSAIGLPDVLQSYAQNRRSGTLVIYRANQPHYLGLQQGAIVYLTGMPAGSLLRALVWVGHISIQERDRLAGQIPNDEAEAARELLDEEIVTVEAVKDALACLIEETFHEAFLQDSPGWDLASEEPEDDWARVQENIGLSIGISSLLMELMRQRDELQSLEVPVREPFDLPYKTVQALPEHADDDQRLIFSLIDQRRPSWQVIIDSWMVPSRGRMALAYLQADSLVGFADGDQVLQQAELCHSEGDGENALGFYQRAIEMGVDQPLARFHLAKSFAQFGSERDASANYFESAADLEADNPEIAIRAYEAAAQIGGEPRVCFRRIAMLCKQLGKHEDAEKAMWALVDFLEAEGEPNECLDAFPELEPLASNRIVFLSRYGDMAQRVGDYQKALNCWDEMESLLDPKRDMDVLVKVHARILAIDPGRCDTALFHARHMHESGETQAAADIMRAALSAAGDEIDPDLAIACHEFLGLVDASDAANRQWLANSYRSRENRQGAIDQLSLLVVAHEAKNNRQGLMDTLQELVELDPLKVNSVRKLCALYDEDGKVEASLQVWSNSIEATLAKGDAKEALNLGEEAVIAHPLAVPLRLALVKGANRLGMKDAAIRHCLAAAKLAHLEGKLPLAKQCLQQVLPVLPQDLGLHTELIEVLEAAEDSDLIKHLGDAGELALKTGNYGLAAAWYERLIDLVEATGEDATIWRQRLLQAYFRSGEHLQAQAAAEHLVDELVTKDRREEALKVLLNIVLHYPRSTNLLMMLARLQRDCNRRKESVQSFLSLIQLLQQEQRLKEAEALLGELARIIADRTLVERLRQQLVSGQAVNWA